mmetsp:Transcript_37144/g.73088  ORF Transcript_37144/g.73088 Transcript_37144/m.73088 type:complete len:105 (-) Transcript_37144:862-1176(-)
MDRRKREGRKGDSFQDLVHDWHLPFWESTQADRLVNMIGCLPDITWLHDAFLHPLVTSKRRRKKRAEGTPRSLFLPFPPNFLVYDMARHSCLNSLHMCMGVGPS